MLRRIQPNEIKDQPESLSAVFFRADRGFWFGHLKFRKEERTGAVVFSEGFTEFFRDKAVFNALLSQDDELERDHDQMASQSKFLELNF